MLSRLRPLSAGFFALLLAGCAVPVAGGLDEDDANRIVVALDHAAVDATKEVDPQVEGHYRISVARDDVARSLAAMQDEALPRPRPSGVLEAMGKGSLVPSETAEHAELVAGLAGDLERTLEGVDGVLSARVHLNVAAPDPLSPGPPPKATASVLVEHRGTTPPVSEGSIQRLVAGGVAGLAPADVSVVMVSRPAPPATPDRGLAHLGPIAVARASRPLLQLLLLGLVALVGVFGAATIYFAQRARASRLTGTE